MRRFGWARLLSALCAASFLAASCGSDDAFKRTAPRAEPPAWLRETFHSVGAAGVDLVAVGDTRGSALPEVRHPDGTWEDLPHLPDRGEFGIVLSVGGTVLVAGKKCSGECESGPFRMFMLAEDRSAWRRLDAPDVTVTSDTEIIPYPNPLNYAVIFVDGDHYRVDEGGAVHQIPPPPTRSATPDIDGGYFLCVGAETMTVVPHHHDEMAGLQLELAGEVSVLELDDLDAGWVSAGAVPPATSTNYNGSMCGPDTATFFGGPTQATFRASTRLWSTGPANFQELTGTDQVPWTWTSSLAFSPDGSTAFVIVDRKLLERAGDGLWQDTGRTAWSIVSTASSVLTFEPDVAPGFVAIWPRD